MPYTTDDHDRTPIAHTAAQRTPVTQPPTAEDLLRPLVEALQHASLLHASVPTCLLLDHLLAALAHGCEVHTPEGLPWLAARQKAVAKALASRLMEELLAVEDTLRRVEHAAREIPGLQARVERLSAALGLPPTDADAQGGT
jgi:hypothetical protein